MIIFMMTGLMTIDTIIMSIILGVRDDVARDAPLERGGVSPVRKLPKALLKKIHWPHFLILVA